MLAHAITVIIQPYLQPLWPRLLLKTSAFMYSVLQFLGLDLMTLTTFIDEPFKTTHLLHETQRRLSQNHPRKRDDPKAHDTPTFPPLKIVFGIVSSLWLMFVALYETFLASHRYSHFNANACPELINLPSNLPKV